MNTEENRPDRAAREFLEKAIESGRTVSGGYDMRISAALVSIASSLVYANYREDNLMRVVEDEVVQLRERSGMLGEITGDEGWRSVGRTAVEEIARLRRNWDNEHKLRGDLFDTLSALRSLAAEAPSDVPELGVRRVLERLRNDKPLELSPAEPAPGRDWSKVEAHLFKPTGKWMYQVFLDYTGERHRGVSGEGPHGWHFDYEAMAKRAFARATENGTSEVVYHEIPPSYHLFVQAPPQGFPIWVHGADWEFERNVGWHPPTYTRCMADGAEEDE